MDNIFNVFDFVVNEENEVMLLIYVREEGPQNPILKIDLDNSSASLFRNNNEIIELSDIEEDTMLLLEKQESILVCELSIEEDYDETEIVHAYDAYIAK